MITVTLPVSDGIAQDVVDGHLDSEIAWIVRGAVAQVTDDCPCGGNCEGC
jgi:hypothetical protein